MFREEHQRDKLNRVAWGGRVNGSEVTHSRTALRSRAEPYKDEWKSGPWKLLDDYLITNCPPIAR